MAGLGTTRTDDPLRSGRPPRGRRTTSTPRRPPPDQRRGRLRSPPQGPRHGRGGPRPAVDDSPTCSSPYDSGHRANRAAAHSATAATASSAAARDAGPGFLAQQVAVEPVPHLLDGAALQQRRGPEVLAHDVVDQVAHRPVGARRRRQLPTAWRRAPHHPRSTRRRCRAYSVPSSMSPLLSLMRTWRPASRMLGAPTTISVAPSTDPGPVVWTGPGFRVTGSRPVTCSLVSPGDFGLWLSLVEHLGGAQGVAGSNPVSPTQRVRPDGDSNVLASDSWLSLRTATRSWRGRSPTRTRGAECCEVLVWPRPHRPPFGLSAQCRTTGPRLESLHGTAPVDRGTTVRSHCGLQDVDSGPGQARSLGWLQHLLAQGPRCPTGHRHRALGSRDPRTACQLGTDAR